MGKPDKILCSSSISNVKDLRTNIEVGNTQSVLDGDLDIFIESALALKVGMKR